MKAWWNKKYNRDLVTYHMSKSRTDWMKYKKTVKIAKKLLFDIKIQEIISFNKRLWNLMNWVKNCKLPATEAIKFNSFPCNHLDDLWNILHQLYNSAQNYSIDPISLMKFLHVNKWSSISLLIQNLKMLSTNTVVCLL